MELSKNALHKIKKSQMGINHVKKLYEPIADEVQRSIFGAGYKYAFDADGNVVGKTWIDSENDMITANNHDLQLNGSIGLDFSNTLMPLSGATFMGDWVNSGVLEFLANNTSVEWAYCYKNGEDGGFLTTSNQPHSVALPPPADFNQYGYDSVIHNHGQYFAPNSGYPLHQIKEYTHSPSDEDIENLSQYGFTSAKIYSEMEDETYNYDSNTRTQQTIASGYGWELQ